MATCFGRPNWHKRFRRINDELYPTTGKDEVTDTSYPIFNKDLKGLDKFIYHIPGFNFLWGLVFARHTYNIDSQHKDDSMKAAAEVLGVLSALLLSVIAGGLGSVSEEELRRTNHFFDDGMYGCISETPGVRDPVTYSKFLIDYGLVALLLCFYSLIAR